MDWALLITLLVGMIQVVKGGTLVKAVYWLGGICFPLLMIMGIYLQRSYERLGTIVLITSAAGFMMLYGYHFAMKTVKTQFDFVKLGFVLVCVLGAVHMTLYPFMNDPKLVFFVALTVLVIDYLVLVLLGKEEPEDLSPSSYRVIGAQGKKNAETKE